MEINATWLDSHEWLLRSSNKGVSYNGYKWKPKGQWNKPDKWNPKAVCPDGLHGNAPEAHGYGFDYQTIELHETRGERIVVDGDKIKVPESRIVARGTEIPDEAFERCGMRVIKDGEKIDEIASGIWIMLAGQASIKIVSGGEVYSYGTSKMEIKAVSGGEVYSCATSKIDIETISGGWVRSRATSKMDIETVSGGWVYSYATSKMDIETVSGGWVYSYGGTIDIKTMSGGRACSYDTSKIDIETGPDGETDYFAMSWEPIAYYDTEQDAQEAVESMAADAKGTRPA